MPAGDFRMHDPPGHVSFEDSFYVHLEAEAVFFDSLFFGGSIRTFMWHVQNSYVFYPERDLYEFRAGVRLSSMELGFRHFCTHPVMPYLGLDTEQTRWEGGYEEVYLRLQTKGNKP